MSQLDQLAQLNALIAGSDSIDLTEIVHSFAQSISAKSTTLIAESLGELHALGIDPDKYIAPSKQHIRNQREQVRINAEKAQLQQTLEHQAELNDLEIRRQLAATELAELTVANAKAKASASA